MQLAAAQEFPLDLTLQAAGVTEAVTVKGNATAMDLSSARIGVNVSEREVQNLPVNGRQMSQLMLQAPGSQNAGTGTWNDVRFSGRANQQNVIKFDGVEGSAIIDAVAGQHRRPDRLAVQAAGQPRERAGVPRRVEQLSGRVRHRHRRPGQRRHQVRLEPGVAARCSSTTATTSSTPRTTSTRPATPTAASSRSCRSRSSASTSSAARSAAPMHEEPRLLLRQLRGLPPRRRRQLRRSRAERGGVGAGGAGHRAAASGLHGAGRRAAAGRVDQPGLRHLPAAEPRERRGELVQRALRLPDERRSGRRTSACSTIAARSCVRKASAAASCG